MSRPLAAITGASAGMGAEFARQLAAKGFDLLLIARRPDRLQQVCQQVAAAHPVRCETMSADLTADEDLLAVENRLRSSGDLALLVNNAGFGALGKFWQSTVDIQDQMHRLHVIAPMRLCHAVLPGFVGRDSGAIINVSSVAGFALSAGSTSYCSTKAWMNRFTEGLYLELKVSKSKVKVQALCPGYTRTEFHQTLEMDTTKIPNAMWLPADRVVRESLAALETGKLFVIPGMRYRALVRMYTMLPEGLRHSAAISGGGFRQRKR